MYHFSVKRHGSFKNVVAEVTEALKTEGFGVLTEIDAPHMDRMDKRQFYLILKSA